MANFKYTTQKRLILVPVVLHGRQGKLESEFILDTGASMTMLDHSLATALGYSARDGIGLSTVSSAIGNERGYRFIVEGFEALGKNVSSFELACHDLFGQGVEGLIGMSFLNQFDWCIHPQRKIISVL